MLQTLYIKRIMLQTFFINRIDQIIIIIKKNININIEIESKKMEEKQIEQLKYKPQQSQQQQEDYIFRIDQLQFSLHKMINSINNNNFISQIQPLERKQHVIAILNKYKTLDQSQYDQDNSIRRKLLLQDLPLKLLPGVIASYKQAHVFNNNNFITQQGSESQNDDDKQQTQKTQKLNVITMIRNTRFLFYFSHIEFRNLLILSISKQNITNIEPLSFTIMPNIKKIDLNFNHINSLQSLVKAQLPDLQHIDLYNNPLSRIQNFSRLHNKLITHFYDRKKMTSQHILQDFTFLFKLQVSIQAISKEYSQQYNFQSRWMNSQRRQQRQKQPAMSMLHYLRKLFI